MWKLVVFRTTLALGLQALDGFTLHVRTWFLAFNNGDERYSAWQRLIFSSHLIHLTILLIARGGIFIWKTSIVFASIELVLIFGMT
jgi:hypothetical protein